MDLGLHWSILIKIAVVGSLMYFLFIQPLAIYLGKIAEWSEADLEGEEPKLFRKPTTWWWVGLGVLVVATLVNPVKFHYKDLNNSVIQRYETETPPLEELPEIKLNTPKQYRAGDLETVNKEQ